MTKKLTRYDTDRDGDEYATDTGPYVHYTDAHAEIERLNRKCGALAFLHYGSSGPDDPWQAKLDEVTKPLHAEIERLQESNRTMASYIEAASKAVEPSAKLDAERRKVLLQALETIESIEGATDEDDAYTRCAARMLAEVLGLPLNRCPLLKESEPRKPLYYSQYSEERAAPHPFREFCTCPSDDTINPDCQLAFPHPWHRASEERTTAPQA